MTVLIDTSAWVEFLRASGSPTDSLVTEIVGEHSYAVTDVVMAELLIGARSESIARRVRAIVDSGRFFPVRPLFDFETASDVGLACRSAGLSVGLPDCLIAAVAINNDLELLAADRDFEGIAELTSLRLAS